MIMVMTAAGAVNMPVLISLNRSFQFLTAYRAFSDFRLVEQEVDDLVLIKRRAKLGCGHWLLLDILDEAPAILGIILLPGLHDEAVHFGMTDSNAIGLADLGKRQAQANPTTGVGAIFFTILTIFT